MTAGLVYYTDGRGDPRILRACQQQIVRACAGRPIVAVTLGLPLPVEFTTRQISMRAERGVLTMFRQILAGLEALETDVAFLVEHDVLYHPSHFDFVPTGRFYFYNEHTFKVDAATGQAVFYYTKQTSGLCADRLTLIDHYRRRLQRCEREGFTRRMGFEPGTHRYPRGIDLIPAFRWMSPAPNVDIRHAYNLTQSRWSPAQFRNADACLGWTLVDEIPSWGHTKGRFDEWLATITKEKAA